MTDMRTPDVATMQRDLAIIRQRVQEDGDPVAVLNNLVERVVDHDTQLAISLAEAVQRHNHATTKAAYIVGFQRGVVDATESLGNIPSGPGAWFRRIGKKDKR